MASGCGSVGSAVAFVTWGPQFKSRHFDEHVLLLIVVGIDEIKEKRAQNGQWLWLSGRSAAVQIQSPAKKINDRIYCYMLYRCWKEKRGPEWPIIFFKKKFNTFGEKKERETKKLMKERETKKLKKERERES